MTQYNVKMISCNLRYVTHGLREKCEPTFFFSNVSREKRCGPGSHISCLLNSGSPT